MPSYHYRADEETAATVARSLALRFLRTPVVWGTVVCVSLVEGVVASLVVNAHTAPRYPGEVIVIGALWGAEIAALVGAFLGVLLLLGFRANRRLLTRRFPPGTEITADLTDDALVLHYPTGTSSIGYALIRKVRADALFVTVRRRGRLDSEHLPAGLLPADAVALLRDRAGAPGPALVGPPVGEHRFTVPPGWSAHVAAAHVLGFVSTRRFAVRALGALVLGGGLVALGWGAGWLVLPVAYVGAAVGLGYLTARRAAESTLPEGSTVTLDVTAAGLVYRRPTVVDEIPFTEVRNVRVHGDVALLAFRSRNATLLLPRALLPDEAMERLSAHS